MDDIHYDNETTKKVFYFFNVRESWENMKDREVITTRADKAIPNNSIRTSKYQWLTFIPLNLMEQFSKMANVYFLVIGIMQMINLISITNGQPVIFAPLVVVVSISMVKDLVEDMKRKKSDEEENERTVLQYQGELGWCKTRWRELRVGDVIRVQCDEPFPSDIVLLNSSDGKGLCFVETKNLDGETNLKQKKVQSDIKYDMNNQLKVKYERPNPYLYRFNGSISNSNGGWNALDQMNMVLRGCYLRNTEWVQGVVVYNGHDSKIMLNSVKARPKRSHMEAKMNFLIIIIFCIQMVVCFGCAIYSSVWQQLNRNDQPYLQIGPNDVDNHFLLNTIVKWGNWILIFTNFVPISLLVSIEMVKLSQGVAIQLDPKTVGNNIKAAVQTSALNEELGQIQYIFSDKTGTLTKNIMDFKQMVVAGVPYGQVKMNIDRKPVSNVDFSDQKFFQELRQGNAACREFLFQLSLCHNVICDYINGEYVYNAQSPDELALINMARYCGWEYRGMEDDYMQLYVEQDQKLYKYKLLHELEFNSTRKRMSVILLNEEEQQIVMYTKGADSIIEKRLGKNNNGSELTNTWQQLQEYGINGLRTLVLSKRELERRYYDEWNSRYCSCLNMIQNREEQLCILQDEIEQELWMVGCSGIEDKLQDEVGWTIELLRQTGIQIWVLTGDKMETAINIGYSCKLLNDEMQQIQIDGSTKQQLNDQLMNAVQSIQQQQQQYALILSGESLMVCDANDQERLLQIGMQCRVVVACRVSPKQKQELVMMVRNRDSNLTTLAIGDGANDVNMITAAHVGIGIKGLEGQQAARAADYSIGEFKILSRLLLYHGRESYRKNSHVILYNFYKNMLLVLPSFWFAFYNGFSGLSLYEPLMYQSYNMFYTSLPIIIYALFDSQYTPTQLTTHPHLYAIGMHHQLFNYYTFFYWLSLGALQAMIFGLLAYPLLSNQTITPQSGWIQSFDSIGTDILGYTVYLGNIKILLISNTFTINSLLINLLSIFLFIITYLLISLFIKSTDIYNTFNWSFKYFTFYLSVLLLVGLTSLIDLAIARWSTFINNDDQLLLKQQNKQQHIELSDSFNTPHRRYSGFAFSQEEPLDKSLKMSSN